MGFLATAEVVECSTTDLIGQYIGHTGPKVQKQLDRGLGKVLFIDEAYRLAEGHFVKEAVDELVDAVTKEKYAKKLVIILAGYEADINRLMATNAGLTSRFSEVINFRSLTPDECIDLLVQELQRNQARLKAKGKHLDLSVVEARNGPSRTRISRLFWELSQGKDWASARDVKEVGKAIFRETMIRDKEGLATGRLTLKMNVVEGELERMLQERRSRQMEITNDTFHCLGQPPPLFSPLNQETLRPASTAATSPGPKGPNTPKTDEGDAAKRKPEAVRAKHTPRDGNEAIRDTGVSDAVWEQLQRDRQAEEQREKEHDQLVKAKQMATKDAEREKIVKRLVEEEERRKKQEAVRQKLMTMGLCPAGYTWIRQAEGYRCVGGSHYMSDANLDEM